MSFKHLIENTKNEYSHKTFLFYVDQEKLSFKDYSNFFVEVETVRFILNKLLDITENLRYVGVCTKQNICLPTLILGCLQNERPFVYIDIENQPEFNCRLIENLHITSIFLDEQSEQLKYIMKAPRLVEKFSIWDVKMQLWETGETLSHTLNKPVMMYAVLTSGSTGEPKTVQVPEQAILPNISDLRRRWSVTEDDVILSASPPTFDPFMVELLLAVTSGAAMLLVSPELRVSPLHLLDAVFPLHAPSLVTVAQLTPSVFTRWNTEQIRTRVLGEDSTLRILSLGGEKFPPVSWWQQCRAEGNKTQLYNLYGTTEVSCWAMVASGTEGTLGSPLSDTQLRVVEDSGQTVTSGTGELYIGSATRLCLVEDEKWEQLQPPVFRATGDLVAVKNNKYEYIERKDNVVKRWGHRVSLDCVESVSAEHAEVAAACCVLHADVLALYICLHQGQGSSAVVAVKADLKQILLKRLNKASVPDVILTLDQLPLNRHGKISKNKLKKMLSDLKDDKITFKDQLDLFQNLWKKYTCEDVIEDSGFISVGGNSVGAMLIVNAMAVRGFNLSMAVLSQMLNNGSLHECCRLIQSQNNSESLPAIRNKTVLMQDEHTLKKRKTDDLSEFLYVKMKGSNNNLTETVGSDVELKIAWSYNLEKCVDASPTCIVYGNGLRLAVVGSHSGRLAALRLESGVLLWEIQLPDRIESSLTPTLCGRRGLIGCYDGCVYCITLDSGCILWSYKTAAMVKGTALIVEDSWIVGSYDYHVYCLGIQAGNLKWKQKMDGILLTTPLFLPQQGLIVVATLAGGVAALIGSTGAVSWATSLPSPVFSSPCLVEEIVVVAEVAGTLHGFQALSGMKVWQYQVGGKIFSSLVALRDSVVFGCHDCSVYRVRCPRPPHIPSLVWCRPTGSAVYATLAMLSPHHLVVASTAGLVSVLDITTGAVLCSYLLTGEVFSSPVSCGNFVVAGCRDDSVYCFEVRNKIN